MPIFLNIGSGGFLDLAESARSASASSGNAVTECRYYTVSFLYILGGAGSADRTVWEGPEPVLLQIAADPIISATKPRMKVNQGAIYFRRTCVIGLKFNLEAIRLAEQSEVDNAT